MLDVVCTKEGLCLVCKVYLLLRLTPPGPESLIWANRQEIRAITSSSVKLYGQCLSCDLYFYLFTNDTDSIEVAA